MTIQDLKSNRDFIIEQLTEKVGIENLKKAMNVMIDGLDCNDSIDGLIESVVSILEFEKYAKKDSKLVRLHSRVHANERFNNFTKSYEKI